MIVILPALLNCRFQRTPRHFDRRFYTAAALIVALIAVTGFARSYYLKFLFAQPSLPILIHIHGVIMTLWVLLFFTQAYLVSARRVGLHRRLGVVGVGLAAVVVILGAYATILATELEVRRHIVGRFHFLLGINLVNLSLFAILFGAALAFRKWPEFHKRLMLLATISLLAPAIARIVLLATHSPVAQFAAFYGCELSAVVIDTIRHRRLHPAFGWGSVLVVGSFQLAYYVVQTSQWMGFVEGIFAPI